MWSVACTCMTRVSHFYHVRVCVVLVNIVPFMLSNLFNCFFFLEGNEHRHTKLRRNEPLNYGNNNTIGKLHLHCSERIVSLHLLSKCWIISTEISNWFENTYQCEIFVSPANRLEKSIMLPVFFLHSYFLMGFLNWKYWNAPIPKMGKSVDASRVNKLDFFSLDIFLLPWVKYVIHIWPALYIAKDDCIWLLKLSVELSTFHLVKMVTIAITISHTYKQTDIKSFWFRRLFIFIFRRFVIFWYILSAVWH